MFNNQTTTATLSTQSSLNPIVEKKLASGVLSEIESGLLFAMSLARMATTPTQRTSAVELVQKAKFSLELCKLANGH